MDVGRHWIRIHRPTARPKGPLDHAERSLRNVRAHHHFSGALRVDPRCQSCIGRPVGPSRPGQCRGPIRHRPPPDGANPWISCLRGLRHTQGDPSRRTAPPASARPSARYRGAHLVGKPRRHRRRFELSSPFWSLQSSRPVPIVHGGSATRSCSRRSNGPPSHHRGSTRSATSGWPPVPTSSTLSSTTAEAAAERSSSTTGRTASTTWRRGYGGPTPRTTFLTPSMSSPWLPKSSNDLSRAPVRPQSSASLATMTCFGWTCQRSALVSSVPRGPPCPTSPVRESSETESAIPTTWQHWSSRCAAGPEFFERSRVCRMLAKLDGEHLLGLVAAAPAEMVDVLRQLDLLSADELVSGRLRGLDLRDRATCVAAFGPSITSETMDFVVAVALRHPHASHLAWLLDDTERGLLPAQDARRLIDRGCPSVAHAAMRHLPLELLVASDRECASRCGDAWMAACPGLAAIERPLLPSRLLRQEEYTASPTGRRIWYPAQLRELEDATFPEACGWQITLPRTIADIRHNAKVMRNCTASLVDQIVEGSLFIVIVHDPSGHRFNVAVHRERDHFVVGQVNSWANGGLQPSWIRAAFTRQLNERDELPSWEYMDRPRRRPTRRRDSRRSRARARRCIRE